MESAGFAAPSIPFVRDPILDEVKRRLNPKEGYGPDWTLVATSLVEAGVDLSFRTGLRERLSTASLIQVGGRVNRHGEWGSGEVIDFLLDADESMTMHPAAGSPGTVLSRLFEAGAFAQAIDPASLVTRSICEELRNAHGATGVTLEEAEHKSNYPAAARLGRMIDVDTRLVVVKEALEAKLANRGTVSTNELLAGSVQMWTNRIEKLGIDRIPGRSDLFVWRRTYDHRFLGYMAGALERLSGPPLFL